MFFNKINKINIACLILAIFCLTTRANAEPTKKDTYEFIATKVTYSITTYDGETKNYKISSDDNMCLLSYAIETIDKDKNWQSTYQLNINLMTINPGTVVTGTTITGYTVAQIETKEKKPLIKAISTYSDKAKAKYDWRKDDTKYNSLSFIYTKDSEDARRVSKALKHLITICGGKDELF